MESAIAIVVTMNKTKSGQWISRWMYPRRGRLRAKRYVRNLIWRRRMIRSAYDVDEYIAAKLDPKRKLQASE